MLITNTQTNRIIRRNARRQAGSSVLSAQKSAAWQQLLNWHQAQQQCRSVSISDGHIDWVEEQPDTRSRYAYNPQGDLIQIIEPDGRRTRYDYDKQRRLTGVHHFNKTHTRYFYGENDRLACIDNRGVQHRFHYTPRGQLAQMQRGNAGSVVFTYDQQNRLKAAHTTRIEDNYTFDDNNRIIASHQTINGITLTVIRSYDSKGRLVRMLFPGSTAPIQYHWDTQDRLAEVSLGERTLVIVKYCTSIDSADRTNNSDGVSLCFVNGVVDGTETDFTNARPQLRRVKDDTQQLFQQSFTYTNEGQICSDGEYDYAYDTLGRLIKVTTLAGRKHWQFSYDAMDNRLQEQYGDTATHYHYNKLGQLASMTHPDRSTTHFEYDRHKHLSSNTHSEGQRSYRYDDAGRLIAVYNRGDRLVDFSYDYKDRLVLASYRSHSERYLYGSSDELLAVTDTQGNLQRLYIPTPLGYLAEVHGSLENGQVYFHHNDTHGTTRLITDSDGKAVARFSYAPFGEPFADKLDFVPFFTGHPWYAAIGLYYFGARWYEPHLGRFLTPDIYTAAPDDANLVHPFAKGKQQPLQRTRLLNGWLKHPRLRNTYIYCNNDPVNNMDPSGHASVGVVLLGILGGIWNTPNTIVGMLLETANLVGEVIRWIANWDIELPFDAAGSEHLKAGALVFKGGFVGPLIGPMASLTFGNTFFVARDSNNHPFFQRRLFDLDPKYAEHFNNKRIPPEVRRRFDNEGHTLGPDTQITEDEHPWRFHDPVTNRAYIIRENEDLGVCQQGNPRVLFYLYEKYAADLDDGHIPNEVRRRFASYGHALAANAEVIQDNEPWHILDQASGQTYEISINDRLIVHQVRNDTRQPWAYQGDVALPWQETLNEHALWYVNNIWLGPLFFFIYPFIYPWMRRRAYSHSGLGPKKEEIYDDYYGGYNLQRGDQNPTALFPARAHRYAGAVRQPGDRLPRSNETTFVTALQQDLRELGFHIVGNPDGDFGLKTFWAVREFQIYAKMDFVAKETPGAPDYVDRLTRVENKKKYFGPVSGVANAFTRELIKHWKDNQWRCPVIINAWDTSAVPRIRTTNIWLHDDETNLNYRMYARDLSGYYTFPEGRNADKIELGKYVSAGSGGPVSKAPELVWVQEAEILPRYLLGIELDELSESQLSTFKVIRAVSEQESIGFFDGLNAWDTGFVSHGPFHWTIAINKSSGVKDGELCAYLAFLEEMNPDAFQKAFGFFGTRITQSWSKSGISNGQQFYKSKCRKFSGWSMLQTDSASHVAIARSEKDMNYFRSWHWFYRLVMAGRTIEGFRRNMWPMARLRIRDLLSTQWPESWVNKVNLPDGTSRHATLGDVFTSECTVALILRWHVNYPLQIVDKGKPTSRMKKILEDAGIAIPAVDPTQWTMANENDLVDQILVRAHHDHHDIHSSLEAVRDWPTWKPPNPNNRKYTLPHTIGVLSKTRGTFNFDSSELPPEPDYAYHSGDICD